MKRLFLCICCNYLREAINWQNKNAVWKSVISSAYPPLYFFSLAILCFCVFTAEPIPRQFSWTEKPISEPSKSNILQKNGDFTYSMVTLGGLIFFMLVTVVLSLREILLSYDYRSLINEKQILFSVTNVSYSFISITLIPLVLFLFGSEHQQ